jgi:hypothetical protein
MVVIKRYCKHAYARRIGSKPMACVHCPEMAAQPGGVVCIGHVKRFTFPVIKQKR